MSHYNVDWRRIIQTLAIYFFLTIAWTWLAVTLDEFTSNDKGLVTGLGYLGLFSISLWAGQGDRAWKKLLLISVLNLLLFVFSSFVLGLLFAFLPTSMELWTYYIFNAFFLSAIYVWLLNKIYSIDAPWLAFGSTSALIVIAYAIIEADIAFLKSDLGLEYRMILFSVFQGMLILGLSTALNVKRGAMRTVE
ncbi:MAG: hypothetical protein ACFB10_24530 [Salibacteraceae bacterium]